MTNSPELIYITDMYTFQTLFNNTFSKVCQGTINDQKRNSDETYISSLALFRCFNGSYSSGDSQFRGEFNKPTFEERSDAIFQY